jgi:hypothetical protein
LGHSVERLIEQRRVSDAHVAAEHVEKLRQSINPSAPQELA